MSPCCAPGSPTRRARPGEELRAPGPGLPPLTSAVSRPGGRVGAVPAETASASRPSPTRPSDRSAEAPFGAAASWTRAGLPERCERPAGGAATDERAPSAFRQLGPVVPRPCVDAPTGGSVHPRRSSPRRGDPTGPPGRVAGAPRGRPGGLAGPLRRVGPGWQSAGLPAVGSREPRSARAGEGRALRFARRLDPPRWSRPGAGESTRNPRPPGWTWPAAPTFGVRTAGGRCTCCRI